MKSYSILCLCIGIATSSLVGISSCNSVESPNFIIILVDDLGARDIGCYGQEYISTPHIDRLADEGMKWTNAYSSCPVCSPTRVALLTGKNQARVHFTGHITSIGRHRHPENSRIIPPDDLMDIPHEEVILPEALQSAGYTSISIGKWHVGREGYWPLDQGFDDNVAGWTHGSPPDHFYPYEKPGQSWNASIPTLNGGNPGEYLTDRLTDEAVKFIRKNKNTPFLVYLSHYAVHVPLQAPDELIEKYKPIVDGTGIDPVYAAMVESVDQSIGRILLSLDELGLEDNTVVIFTSDNGAMESVTDNSPFRRGKGHLYEGGLRVPYIMKWPGHIKPGSASHNPTISSDIYATIIDIVGPTTTPGSPLDGRSLMKDFKGETAVSDFNLYWYYPHYSPQQNMPGAAIRSGDYKLIEFYDPQKIELYDLANDIGETHDLADSLPELKDNLLEELHKWLASTNPIMHSLNPEYIHN
jgi:arylsulfatase A-like enzyme